MVEGLSRAQPINEGTAAFITMKILPVPQTEPHQGNCLCWGSGAAEKMPQEDSQRTQVRLREDE